MRATKTKGGLILPDQVTDPQGYGKVLSVGENVPDKIKVDDFMVFHPRGGMDMLIDGSVLKVLKYDEIYGVLQNDEIKESLKPLQVGKQEESKIIH